MRNSILRVRPQIACHAPPDIASVSCSNVASGGLDGGLMGLDRLGWLCLGLPVFLPTCLPPRVARQATGGARARSSCLAPSGEERARLAPSWEQSKPMRAFTCELTWTPGASLRPSHRGPAYRVLFISISFGHSRQIRPPRAMNRNVNVASLLQGVEAR